MLYVFVSGQVLRVPPGGSLGWFILIHSERKDDTYNAFIKRAQEANLRKAMQRIQMQRECSASSGRAVSVCMYSLDCMLYVVCEGMCAACCLLCASCSVCAVCCALGIGEVCALCMLCAGCVMCAVLCCVLATKHPASALLQLLSHTWCGYPWSSCFSLRGYSVLRAVCCVV